MKRLARAIADRVTAHVRSHVENLQGDSGEFRAIFNGPPAKILAAVFQLLTIEGGIEAKRGDGNAVTIPVVLQVDHSSEGTRNPPIGQSGLCNAGHLLDLRNSPNCPIFVGLAPPGQHATLSQRSTRSDFGLLAQNNSGTARASDWWEDKFVQSLVAGALERHSWPTSGGRDDARGLVEHAVFSADEVDKHDVSRRGAWLVLARLWSISESNTPFGTRLSLACGYPPCEDGTLDRDGQIAVLRELSSRIEDAGFRPAIEKIKLQAKDDDEKAALDEVLIHLQGKCDALTALGRSTPYYYGPSIGDVIDQPPHWWQFLTVERWKRLLEEGNGNQTAIRMKCINSIISQTRGFVPVAESSVKIRITLPEAVPSPIELIVTRDCAGAGSHREWTVLIDSTADIEDESMPPHKAAARYTAKPKYPTAAATLKKGAIRVISLAAWEPGIIVCSRTAFKGTVPKTPRSTNAGVAFEASLSLNGQGRHYLDIYVKSGVQLSEFAEGSDQGGVIDKERTSSIAKVSDTKYGFEVEATSDNFYQFRICRPTEAKENVVRIYLAGDEVAAEECGSEFDRLIRLNRQRDGGRATTAVQVDRQLRCTDLQSWMLSEDKVGNSFYPLVFAGDYARDWRTRDWGSRKDTVFSRGKFLNDPRPSPEDMRPPEAFLQFRASIARRIRGDDQNGLVEAARLGEWLVADSVFAEEIEGYVRSYAEWLESAPDCAAWCDISIVTRFEADGTTLVQEPDAILVSPLHPIRLAWHCLAQRALFLAQQRYPCPAASILDPDCVPDALVLPLRTPAGGIKGQVFFSVECSSDYWGVLWNGNKLDRLSALVADPPFDQEFGVLVGGVSSGFSVAQVHRALDDVSEMLVAKPVLSVLVSSAAGQNNACNEGLISWCREHYSVEDQARPILKSLGVRLIQVLDERKPLARPEDAKISNLIEDTGNSVRWYGGADLSIRPDLGIIAQLETCSAGNAEVKIGSPLSFGGLIRSRIRQQIKGNAGAFLSETRMGLPRPASGDGLADRTMAAMVRLENLADARYGYVFAPSVPTIQAVLQKAEYAAISSSAVDPACFLGGWLEDTYLWDYDLPAYSSRAGDSNGYYLLSRIKEVDREALNSVLSLLPGCKDLPRPIMEQVILEVARRGIPTVRGLSGGDCGASGDLGLFVAARLLQDEFRATHDGPSLFPVWGEREGATQIVLIMPVDPFRSYLDDLTRAIKKNSNQRPDLIVAAINISDSQISCRLTPVEVKYRGSKEPFTATACLDALRQAMSLSELLSELSKRSDKPEMLLWKLAFQHLLISMLGFGFRVYSQQVAVLNRAEKWSEHHSRLVEAILAEELKLEIDQTGRLIVIDGSIQSAPRDADNDGFTETIVISHNDAASIVKGEGSGVYKIISERLKDWNVFPCKRKEPMLDSTEKSKGSGHAPAGVVPVVQLGKVSAEEKLPTPRSALTAELDTRGTGVDLFVGNTVDGFREDVRRLNLSDTNLNQLNIGVVGDLGTGKTQLLKSLIYQMSQSADANQGVKPRVLIFDYKKDYSSEDFVKAVGARVVKPQHLPLNLFDITGAGNAMAPWLDRFKFFSDVLDKIFSGVGPVQRGNLKTAVREAYAQCELLHRQPNIYDVHSKYKTILAGRADAVSSIIDDLVDMEIFSREPIGVTSFDEFLDGIVVISLDDLGQDDRTKNMLVAIMLNMFYEHMLRIPKRPYVGGDVQLRVIDSFLLVDEATNIMKYEFDVLKKILLQGREFGVGVILASQFLRHFKGGGTDYREPLLSWFIHKVPNVTPQELSALGLTGNTAPLAERVKSLARHEFLFKTFNVPGEIVCGVPFYKLVQQ